MKSKGLGDSIEKVLKKSGLKSATDFIFDKLGKDCGCDKRKEKLNKLFPYKQINCLIESEYNYLKNLFKVQLNTITNKQQQELLEIYNRVFNANKQKSSCGSCVKELINEMKKLYNTYEKEKQP
jgi:hypothetical protein